MPTRSITGIMRSARGLDDAGTGLVATIPRGLFEIFFGIWLIAKGFNPSAITIGAANTAGAVTP